MHTYTSTHNYRGRERCIYPRFIFIMSCMFFLKSNTPAILLMPCIQAQAQTQIQPRARRQQHVAASTFNINTATTITDVGITYAELHGLGDRAESCSEATHDNVTKSAEEQSEVEYVSDNALSDHNTITMSSTRTLSNYFSHRGCAAHGRLQHGCSVADKAGSVHFTECAMLGHLENGERVYLNTHEPFCLATVGVQGAGKSHTLACTLESCLIPFPEEDVVRLGVPMTALVLHYDQSVNSVCEATGLMSPTKMLRSMLGPVAEHRCLHKVCFLGRYVRRL
jgi:hypothetical protein